MPERTLSRSRSRSNSASAAIREAINLPCALRRSNCKPGSSPWGCVRPSPGSAHQGRPLRPQSAKACRRRPVIPGNKSQAGVEQEHRPGYRQAQPHYPALLGSLACLKFRFVSSPQIALKKSRHLSLKIKVLLIRVECFSKTCVFKRSGPPPVPLFGYFISIA